MIIKNLSIKNFMGVPDSEIEFRPFTLICGPNWSGKTTTQQAVRLALSGDIPRVKQKGHWRYLVRNGARSAQVTAQLADGTIRQAIIKASVSGHSVPTDAVVPQALMDPGRMTRAQPEQFIDELLFVLGHSLTEPKLRDSLKKLDVSDEVIEEIVPMIALGAPAMVEYAKERERDAKSQWVHLTGESIYGMERAATWEAVDPINPTVEQAAKEVDKHHERLMSARQQVADYEPKVLRAEATLARAGATHSCPKCGVVSPLVSEDEVLQLRSALPEMKRGLEVLRTAVLSRERDYEKACNAARLMKEGVAEAAKLTADAAALNERVLEWRNVADLLSPLKVPLQTAWDKVHEINTSMSIHAEQIGFPVPEITKDGLITVDGRLFALLSEAEQWAAEALLLIALSEVSPYRIVILDRLDVLWPNYRSAMVKLLMRLSETRQVIVFATTKQAPNIPESDQRVVYWIESGRLGVAGKVEEEAA